VRRISIAEQSTRPLHTIGASSMTTMTCFDREAAGWGERTVSTRRDAYGRPSNQGCESRASTTSKSARLMIQEPASLSQWPSRVPGHRTGLVPERKLKTSPKIFCF